MIKKTENPGLYPKNLGEEEQAVPASIAVLLQNGFVRKVLVGFLHGFFDQIDKWIKPLAYFDALNKHYVGRMELPRMGLFVPDHLFLVTGFGTARMDENKVEKRKGLVAIGQAYKPDSIVPGYTMADYHNKHPAELPEQVNGKGCGK